MGMAQLCTETSKPASMPSSLASRLSFMKRPPISASGFADLLPDPPEASAEWRAFSLQVVEPPPLHLTIAFADHVLSTPISGGCRLRRKVGGRSIQGRSHPGNAMLTPAHYLATWDADASVRLILLYMPQALLFRVITEDWKGTLTELRSSHSSSFEIRLWETY
jgi:hypothetical protein